MASRHSLLQFVFSPYDTISWIAFLMPIMCIDEFRIYFACTSWVLGDLMLLGAFWISQKHISENDIYERL